MALYDLHLLQNTSAGGVEFTEKIIDFGSHPGALLVAGAAGALTVLAPGTEGHYLRVASGGTTLEWAAVASATDALIYKGTIGSGGTWEIAAFNSNETYSVGWTYRVKTAGTIKGIVCEVGDIITAIVSRSGTGGDNADWTAMQTNLDGAVIGPASVTGGEMAVFDGATGKLIKAHASGAPGTMAFETATNYVAKSLFDANTVLFATSDNTPAALLGTELPPKLWAAVPADMIGTGYTGTAIAGQIARDANYIYVCETGGTATNQVWSRLAKATNWVNPS